MICCSNDEKKKTRDTSLPSESIINFNPIIITSSWSPPPHPHHAGIMVMDGSQKCHNKIIEDALPSN
jgi:hypothetical protein